MAFIGSSPKLKRVRYTPQSSAPSNPIEGDVFYSDGTALAEGLYVYKNGTWQDMGTSAGGINYIENPDAESGITDWNEYDDGASATPIDGTGGTAANITLSANTVSPLRGVADFKIAKGAADAQGEGVSYDFTIDNADKLKTIEVSFDYSTSVNYADDDIGVYIYDVTNSTVINLPSAGVSANSNNDSFSSIFQTTSSSSYRLIFHVQSTSALAYDFSYDNVKVGPRTSDGSSSSVISAKLDLTSGTHTNNANWQDIPYNVSTFDTSSIITGSTFVVPESGYYFVNASVGFASSTGTQFGLRFVINGTSDSRTSFGISTFGIINLSQVYLFTKGDVIKTQALQASGGSLAYDSVDDTWMNIFKIAGTDVVVAAVRSYQEIKYDTRAGFGSTNTQIPYFSNTTYSKAAGDTLFTAANSSTNGVSFTILKKCKVSMIFNVSHTGTGEAYGISKNAINLTSPGGYKSASNSIRIADGFSTTDNPTSATVTFIAEVSDVLRPHNNNPASLGTSTTWSVTIFAEEL